RGIADPFVEPTSYTKARPRSFTSEGLAAAPRNCPFAAPFSSAKAGFARVGSSPFRPLPSGATLRERSASDAFIQRSARQRARRRASALGPKASREERPPNGER